jgi:hypothetical protein
MTSGTIEAYWGEEECRSDDRVLSAWQGSKGRFRRCKARENRVNILLGSFEDSWHRLIRVRCCAAVKAKSELCSMTPSLCSRKTDGMSRAYAHVRSL